nr:MAG TPA: hypothetical protein [Caudoviricetes sp.]
MHNAFELRVWYKNMFNLMYYNIASGFIPLTIL